jgi:hypothetical protein
LNLKVNQAFLIRMGDEFSRLMISTPMIHCHQNR